MNKHKKKIPLVYILSPSYSGSTLLTLLLAQHPKLATIGELKATRMGDTRTYKCSCGSPILECTFWGTMLEKAKLENIAFNVENFGTHFASDSSSLWNKILGAQVRGRVFEWFRFNTLRHVQGLKSRYQEVQIRNRDFIRLALDIQGATQYLDGSKDPNRLLYLLDSGYYELFVIKMTRDGRAQTHSQRAKAYFDSGYEAAVKEWRYTIEQMDRAVSWFPKSSVIDVRYEDLCANPDQTMNQLWRFLNLAPTGHDWKNVDLESANHHIVGNNMRTKSHISVSLDERWESEMTTIELASFEKIAGKINKRLGYK